MLGQTRIVRWVAALLAVVPLLTFAKLGDGPFEHVLCEAVSLDGAWEMAYLPYAWETPAAPAGPTQEQLLTEIRDLLAKQNKQ